MKPPALEDQHAQVALFLTCLSPVFSIVDLTPCRHHVCALNLFVDKPIHAPHTPTILTRLTDIEVMLRPNSRSPHPSGFLSGEKVPRAFCIVVSA